MNYVESFNLLGVEAKQIPTITGEGVPTTTTEGAQGCLYMDTISGKIYKCTNDNNNVYTWEEIKEAGGEAYEALFNDGVLPCNPYRTIYVGDNLFNAANLTLGDGWSYNEGVLTHTALKTEPATLTFNGANGEIYLLEFTTSYTEGEFVKISIGDGYPEFAYSGTNSIIMPIKCYGSPILNIVPYKMEHPVAGNTKDFTITNISLRKIQDEGEEVSLYTRQIITKNNPANYGYRNVVLGYGSFQESAGSTRTVCIGNFNLADLKGGHRNVAIGGHVFNQLKGGESNIGIGADAGQTLQNGSDNIAIGCAALGSGEDRSRNVAIGTNALNGGAGSVGNANTAIGYYAAYRTTGKLNVALGYKAGENNKKGIQNVMIGASSSTVGEESHYHTFVGSGTGCTTECSNTIALGYGVKTTKSNQMILGPASITEVVMCGNKKINFNTDGTVTWEEISSN